MDHKAYEKEMINTINHRGESTKEPTKANWSLVMNKNDGRIVTRGLKRTVLALLTVALFTLGVIGLILTASTPGYLAVLMFLVSIVEMLIALVLLYAQGINHRNHKESTGESK